MDRVEKMERNGDMKKFWNFVHRLKPVLMMIAANVFFGGMSILYKIASAKGMSLRILIAYRYIIAAILSLPIAFYTERKTRPKLTLMILLQAFSCALFGNSMAQNLIAESLVLTSATLATAISNLIPAAIFILAIIFGLEKLSLKTKAGQAKVIGLLIGIGGAMLLTFYKGREFYIWSTQSNLLDHSSGHIAAIPTTKNPHSHILGVLLAFACVLSHAISLTIQAKMIKLYSCNFSSTALINVMASLQSTGFALCTERDWGQWKLGWNLKLLIVVYAGVVASTLATCFMMCSISMRGPVFVSAFNPFMLICVAIASTIFLKENLYLGSVIGAVAIIVGLYMVIWGKHKEMKEASKLAPAESDGDEEVPHSNKKDVNLVAVAPNFISVPGRVADGEKEVELQGVGKGDFNV
ncbi:PREDICTED: WAT1-related protein At1g25270-like [Ipomoea nil]|uniref:WAT1-related protein At1g25270-like n=1 Tax=Ipomoea nil TaxID=35883 RepID=UPI0009017ECC|nr:PREDICTED: WAT1-related protein At1g25270-like [Ipomoea nil]